MRHRKNIAKLGRTAEHRKATLANLASALIEHRKIKTTHAKAKATQRFVEKLVTLAKKGDLNSRRLVLSRLRNKEAMYLLFSEIAPTFTDRNGGYTRVIHLGRRFGDGAEMSLLEFVGFETVAKKHKEEHGEKEKAKSKETAKPVEKKTEKPKPAEEKAEKAEEEKAEPAEEKAAAAKEEKAPEGETSEAAEQDSPEADEKSEEKQKEE